MSEEQKSKADAYETIRETLGFNADVDPQEVVDAVAGRAIVRDGGSAGPDVCPKHKVPMIHTITDETLCAVCESAKLSNLKAEAVRTNNVWRQEWQVVLAKLEQWKAEAHRLRTEATRKPDLSDPASIQQIIDHLKAHRFTHQDWASWFEQHPDDPRAKSDIGDAAFHREAVARYDRMIAGLELMREVAKSAAVIDHKHSLGHCHALKEEVDQLHNDLKALSADNSPACDNCLKPMTHDGDRWRCPHCGNQSLDAKETPRDA